jgi:hypothetical protein
MNYKHYILGIFLFVFFIQIVRLYHEKNELSSLNTKMIKKQKRLSEIIVKNKIKEIDSLKQTIKQNEFLINNALKVINDLNAQKNQVEIVYIEKIKKIKTLDANELKNYFDEELK